MNPPAQREATAVLQEVFSSVQGEGPWVGERQLFVRFYSCHLDCAFCDTPETKSVLKPRGFSPPTARCERTPGERDFQPVPNPFTVSALVELVARYDVPSGLHHSVAITGGEPLLHASFLRHALPLLKQAGLRIYLETAGDLHVALRRVIEWVDLVAMDIKIPSVTRDRPLWEEHREFLKVAVEREVFAKAVVGRDTTDDELLMAARVVLEAAPSTLLVLQPVTPFGAVTEGPTSAQLLRWQALARELIPNVRVIPQCHKAMGAL